MFASFGLSYGPAAPPRQDLVDALRQRMLVLGYTPSVGGVYGESEDAVVQSYADQIGLSQDDRLDLNGVIAAILPVMDADIEAAGLWQGHNTGITGDPVNVTGRAGGGGGAGVGLLALVALAAYALSQR